MIDQYPTALDRAFISTAQALDAAFAGESCDVVTADGSSRALSTDRWTGEASPADLALFVEPCTGPTLDVGCGPGRLAGALVDRGVDVLGVDISPEAVRQTRSRGATALCGDVFAQLPGANRWHHVLLADGNIGLGGHPARLLRRIADLLSPHGTALVELDGTGAVAVHENLCLRVGERLTHPFDWATVGTQAIDELAAAAGLVVTDLRQVSHRSVASLQHRSVSRSLR